MMKSILAKRLKRIAEELETNSRKKTLADFLGVEEDEIQNVYDEFHFEVPGEGEFAVYTDEEADNEFARQIEEFIDEMGISGFSESFQEEIKSYLIIFFVITAFTAFTIIYKYRIFIIKITSFNII